METRKCQKCLTDKSLTDFYYDARYKGADIHCKECRKEKVKSYRVANLERVREQSRQRRQLNPEPNRRRAQEWHIKNRDRHLAYMRKRREEQPDHVRSIKLKAAFGITYEDYKTILTSQNNCCAICGKTPQENRKRLAVDHCHTTKQVRGLLCSPCNQAIGLFKDNPNNLYSAIAYLHYHNEHPTNHTNRTESIGTQTDGGPTERRAIETANDA